MKRRSAAEPLETPHPDVVGLGGQTLVFALQFVQIHGDSFYRARFSWRERSGAQGPPRTPAVDEAAERSGAVRNATPGRRGPGRPVPGVHAAVRPDPWRFILPRPILEAGAERGAGAPAQPRRR